MSEHTFTIDGKEYEIPITGEFDMDEAQILWDCTEKDGRGYVVEDFAPDQEDGTYSEERIETIARMMVNPGFRRALMTVAYRRANRDASRKHIEAAVGRAQNVESLNAWAELLLGEADEDDARPPSEKTSEPDESSKASSADSSESSGSPSEETSDVASPSTGAQEIETPAPSSDAREDEPVKIHHPTGATRSDTSAISDPMESVV